MTISRSLSERITITLLVLATGMFFSGASHAATYYVNASASDDSGDGSQSRPKKYIGSGSSLMSSSGGDVLMVAAGTYSSSKDSLSSVPSGKAGAYNVVRAATDGTVAVTPSFALGKGDHYLQFEGIKFDYGGQKAVAGRYVKFLRCAFKGGPSSGNVMNLVIGTNDATPGAQYILLEDSWLYGPGGRYKVLIYNSDSIILRRVVVRHDGGWNYDGDNPQSGITSYNSKNVRLQNVMVIDSMSGLAGYEASIYLVGNSSSSTSPGNVKVEGSIVLNGPGNGIAFDDHVAYSNSAITDSVVWGASAGGIAANGANHQASITRALVKSQGTGYANWSGGGGLSVSNSIAYQNSGSAVSGVSASNMVSFGNSSNTGTVIDPRQNGLKYLPRIEDGSPLKTMGSGGGQIGPQIVKRIGVSGTLYGDAGYDDVTSQDLWPWPNETRIKSDFSEVAARGLTATTGTLTDYIWGYLGNPSPITAGVVPKAPTNVTVN